METDSDSSCATERSFEVEDYSPPSSPEMEVPLEETPEAEDSGPEPYRFEPLAPAPEAAGAAEAAVASQHRMGPVSDWYICICIVAYRLFR